MNITVINDMRVSNVNAVRIRYRKYITIQMDFLWLRLTINDNFLVSVNRL